MPSIEITKIQTMNQKSAFVPARFFRLHDALALEVFISVSPDLLVTPRVMYQVVFEIIDATTNSVIFKKPVLAFFKASEMFLLCGEHIALADRPVTHPSDFGLPANGPEPFSGQGIYGFRAIVKALQIIRTPGQLRDRLVSLDAFDVSNIHWFRIEVPSILIDDLINTPAGIWPGEPGVSVKDNNYPGEPPFRDGVVRPQPSPGSVGPAPGGGIVTPGGGG